MKNNHVLLAVTGLSPQVVTETLYGLYALNKTMPSSIVIITTQIGANEAQKKLLEEGKLQQFCHDYNLPEIILHKKDIHVIPDKDGQIFNDVNAQQQMNTLADFICQKVQQLTAKPHLCIHASLAGGRKTMTFFLGMAMSLYGREQDILSHVLVSEGYEASDFFYPTPYSHNITNYRGSILDAKHAKVALTEIPFVRLRSDSPDKLLEGVASYSETVEWLNYDTTNEMLTININNRTLKYCNKTCQLPPVEFAFYQWFYELAKNQIIGLSTPHDEKTAQKYADEFLKFYAQHVDEFQIDDLKNTFNKIGANDIKGMDKSYFEGRKTNIKKAIIKVFGKRIGEKIIIKNIGKTDGKYHFAIDMPTQLIKGE